MLSARILKILLLLTILLCDNSAFAATSDLNSSCSTIGITEGPDASGNNLICNGSKKWVYPTYITGNVSTGGSSVSCSASTAGALQWTGSIMQYCDGSGWWTINVNGGSTGPGSTPSFFSFRNQTGVATSSTISSNTVTLQGFTGSATATCGSGCISISRNGGAFTAGPVSGFVTGDTIAIQQASSGTPATQTSAAVTVGTTTSSNWNITTGSAAPFSFTNVTSQAVNSTISSNAVLLTGFTGTVTATCGPGCTGISINSGAYSAGPVTGVAPNNTIAIQQTSSSFNSTATTATVNVGGTWSSAWSVTTVAPPTAITFTDLTGNVINTVTQATPVQVTWTGGGTMTGVCGTNCTGIGRCSGPTLGTCGGFTTTQAGFNSGDYISIQMTSANAYNTAKQAILTFGGATSAPWTVTTTQSPPAFGFADAIGAALGATVKATPVLLTWNNGGTLTPTCTGACTGIAKCTSSSLTDCGAFTVSPGTFSSGDYISIQQAASGSYGTQVSASTVLGATTALARVTTLQQCFLNIVGFHTSVVPSTISGNISYVMTGGAGGTGGANGSTGGTAGTASTLVTGNWTPSPGDIINAYAGGGGGGGGGSPSCGTTGSAGAGGGGGGYFGGGGGGAQGAVTNAGGGGGGGGSTALLAGAAGTQLINGVNGGAGANGSGVPGSGGGAGTTGGAGAGAAGQAGSSGTSGNGNAGGTGAASGVNISAQGGGGPGFGGWGGASCGNGPQGGGGPGGNGVDGGGAGQNGAGGGGGGSAGGGGGLAVGGLAGVCSGTGTAAKASAAVAGSNNGGGGGGGCIGLTYIAASCSM